ncbi:synaptotagmin-6 isoform X2 [Talpa occidentalis]|uniref:synaptotagmin-6 isoform X2 n=1 Tax=Talpa occidentalis TaxID=50954 RepID=UPI0023F96A02|nr:synaptotagmin-6 isoform X2 [Talpa occidentalis]
MAAARLATVAALIEIQKASKCERFTNLHICFGCCLNYFPFRGARAGRQQGGGPGAPRAGHGGEGATLENQSEVPSRPQLFHQVDSGASALKPPPSSGQLSHDHSFLFFRLCPFCVPLFQHPGPLPRLCLSCPPAWLALRAGTSVSLLAVVVIVCGLALVAVFLFLFWKLCWMPWRGKEASSPSSANPLPEPLQSPSSRGNMADKLKDPGALGFLETAVKISHTSPDIPAEVQMSVKEHIMRHTRLQRQTTEPASSTRHTSFKRHLPRQMHVSSVDYGNELPPAAEQPTSIGRIKPELYKQKSVDGDEAKSEAAKSCGKINFSLRYDYESETLIVRILKAFDLPAKDFCGSSDPYVKIYLLPDRKCKLQTRVHRKTLNPTFDENFHFPVPYEELADRKLHLSVFDFDRFSRHDMIGEVILDNLFEASDLSRETSIWKDIQYATSG